ncbi:MAG: RNA polymerase sigma factor [Lysobacteraceae bacterium]
MTQPPTDEELMLAYAAGDISAFEALYARHRGPLFRFLVRGISPRATAEECFQEVWSRIVTARERYRPEAKFSTWLYQIANNLLIDQYRRARPSVSIDDEETGFPQMQAEASEQPEPSLSRLEESRRLQQALAELPEEQRIAVQLRLEQELSLEEIGEITGVGRETVKSRLRYALDKLKARLA